MPQLLNRLSAKQVKDCTEPGRHSDGGGLYLQVSNNGAKSWLFRYRWNDKRPEVGLGGYPAVTLAAARRKAEEGRSYLSAKPKVNPRDVWTSQIASEETNVTFGTFTETFLELIIPTFKNEKHRYQWGQSLRVYAKNMWHKNIDELDTKDLLACLEPIWATKHETATRLRGRIERILDAAKAKGLREGENPARWRGHLSAILPTVNHAPVHQAAMPYDDVPGFMSDLAAVSSVTSKALQFLILTACRSSEVREATWSEVDFDALIWTIPPARMKAARAHRVPLSEAAIAILRDMKRHFSGRVIFQGQKYDQAISETSVRKLMARLYPKPVLVQAPNGEIMKRITQHGFRSSFRDWAGDKTSFSREVAELALSHNVGNAVERAYRRGDALEKRRRLMDEWAVFCCSSRE